MLAMAFSSFLGVVSDMERSWKELLDGLTSFRGPPYTVHESGRGSSSRFQAVTHPFRKVISRIA